jgi:hypothetical protein
LGADAQYTPPQGPPASHHAGDDRGHDLQFHPAHDEPVGDHLPRESKWRIVTASILSEWEQGGISMAAAYSTIIISSFSPRSAPSTS